MNVRDAATAVRTEIRLIQDPATPFGTRIDRRKTSEKQSTIVTCFSILVSTFLSTTNRQFAKKSPFVCKLNTNRSSSLTDNKTQRLLRIVAFQLKNECFSPETTYRASSRESESEITIERALHLYLASQNLNPTSREACSLNHPERPRIDPQLRVPVRLTTSSSTRPLLRCCHRRSALRGGVARSFNAAGYRITCQTGNLRECAG